MDVGGSDLGATRERDPDDVRDIARHEAPRDNPAFPLGDRRAGPDGGHFREAVDFKLWHGQVDPGSLHKAKALDPFPWPDELRLHDREIVADDQKRHPRPLALHRVREGVVKLLGAGIFGDDPGSDRWLRIIAM